MNLEQLKKANTDLIKEIKTESKILQNISRQIKTLSICQKIRCNNQKKLAKELYIAEGKMKILPTKDTKTYKQRTEKSLVEQNIKNLPKPQQAKILKRLLDIRAERQAKNTDRNKNLDNCR